MIAGFFIPQAPDSIFSLTSDSFGDLTSPFSIMPSISAVIITLNEEAHIGRCLDSLKGLADEIVVVDDGSTDKTREICEAAGARFFEYEWQGYAESKNWANAQASHPYILSIDADEALSEELKTEILAHKDTLSGAYRFPRLNRYIDQWVRHGGWYPDRKIRLFPHEKARWEGGYVHEKLVLEKGLQVTDLRANLLHYTINSLSDHWQRIDKYMTLAAEEMYAKGKKPRFYHWHIRPAWVFFRAYVLKRGFLDGVAGWSIARISATGEWYKFAKLRELIRKNNDQ